MGRCDTGGGCGKNRRAAQGRRDYGAAQSGGTGDLSGWQGYLREADQGLYGEAVGTRLQGSSGFYY